MKASLTITSLFTVPAVSYGFSTTQTPHCQKFVSRFWNVGQRLQSDSWSLNLSHRMFGDGSGRTLKDKIAQRDDEFHPHDVARTTPQLMHALWGLIADASKNMERGDSFTVLFPQMNEQLSNPSFVTKLMGHLDACKDVCDNFGVNTVLVPFTQMSNPNLVHGFTVKSYRNPNAAGTFSGVDDASKITFAHDPLWDENEVWDFSGLDDENHEELDTERQKIKNLPEIQNVIPKEDETILHVTKKWVKKMMADLALCPFTHSAEKSGIPIGPVRYHIDRVITMEDAYTAYWQEVCRIEGADEDTISTTLQILPEFCINSVEMFEQWADTLTGTLEALQVETLLQLIFFHPQWAFRDGGDRSGSGLAANYARRSPWPMVNILRTKQVRIAQKGIPTGLVYQQNDKTLSQIGMYQLEKMLRLRDWTEIEGVKVNRKDMEALRVAQNLQVEGVVREKDTSFVYDSTPAANKVDRTQIDGGNMVNVIREALEIRLRKKSVEKDKTLNGAQTSATLMASDFLLEELDRLVKEYPGRQKAAVLDDDRETLPGRPHSALASGGYAAAYGFDSNDYDNMNDGSLNFRSGQELEDAEMSALFGGGGIPKSNFNDENPRGMDLLRGF